MRTDKPDEQPPIPNAHYEELLRMRSNNPIAWRVLSPNTKAAVQYYEIAKQKFEPERAREQVG